MESQKPQKYRLRDSERLQIRKGETKDANDLKRNDKLSQENGFEIISQNGSHVKMLNPKTNKTVIVPYHCKDLKKVRNRQY